MCVPSAAFAIPFCSTRLASTSRGADYRVPSRGARREPICRDFEDKVAQPGISAQAKGRFDSRVPIHRQTGYRFGPILDPRRANLSRLMRHVNGVYPQPARMAARRAAWSGARGLMCLKIAYPCGPLPRKRKGRCTSDGCARLRRYVRSTRVSIRREDCSSTTPCF